MIVFINSSKTMDFDNEVPDLKTSKPIFLNQANQLASIVIDLGFEKMQDIMGISDKLANLNFDRYLNFSKTNEERPAIYAYRGDVYTGLNVEMLEVNDLSFGQKHIRIISGLYGLLKPLDKIKPYRMEMGYKISNDKKLDVYWREILKENLKNELAKAGNIVINLSSKEYSSAIESAKEYSQWIDVEFLDYAKGDYKFITLYGKKARGMMARYIMKNKINNPEQIKKFDYEGYIFSQEKSTKDKFVFIRDEI